MRKKNEPEIANAKPKPDQGWQSLTSTNAWGQARELLSNGLTMQQARAAAGPWRAGGAPPRCKAERLPRRACLSRRMLHALLACRAAGAAASCVSCFACRRSPALARGGLLTLAICGIRSCHIRSVGGTRTECAPRLAGACLLDQPLSAHAICRWGSDGGVVDRTLKWRTHPHPIAERADVPHPVGFGCGLKYCEATSTVQAAWQ